MLQIVLHSSKTMRRPPTSPLPYQAPALLAPATQLANYVATLSAADLARVMKLSDTKAAATADLWSEWSAEPSVSRPAIDAFVGDIYSGLAAQMFDEEDRAYANTHLLILSGLYGGLRALDSIVPYRLEMGYRLPDEPYRNLYRFWGERIAQLVPPATTQLINLSAVEYTKALLPYVDIPVITPKFLTLSPTTKQPTFVTVHTKIARGAYARWLITRRIDDSAQLPEFAELGYQYDQTLSTSNQPVFVCRQFGGIGLSQRTIA